MKIHKKGGDVPMKKIFGPLPRAVSLVLVFLLCISLTACQDSPGGKASDSRTEGQEPPDGAFQTEPAPVEISLWTYPIGNWSNSTVIASLLADFNKQYPHIRVSVKYLDYNTGDSLIEEAISRGEAPLRMRPTAVTPFIPRKISGLCSFCMIWKGLILTRKSREPMK